jgi:ATPase subunit of ABC transporter with duplicated ATPase domains
MSFKYRQWVFQNLSLDILGSQIGLVGKNGSGKTTLLRLLDGQLAPQRGEIRVGGTTYMVHFDLSAYKAFFLDDLIDLCSHLRSFDTSRAEDIVRRLFLEPHRRSPISELSKGTAKKVSLVLGLMSVADVLLLDEPHESLDEESTVGLSNMLKERNGAHMIVSHDQSALRACVSEVYSIRDHVLHEAAMTEENS